MTNLQICNIFIIRLKYLQTWERDYKTKDQLIIDYKKEIKQLQAKLDESKNVKMLIINKISYNMASINRF